MYKSLVYISFPPHFQLKILDVFFCPLYYYNLNMVSVVVFDLLNEVIVFTLTNVCALEPICSK